MYWSYMNHSHISSFSKTAFLPSTAFPHAFQAASLTAGSLEQPPAPLPAASLSPDLSF